MPARWSALYSGNIASSTGRSWGLNRGGDLLQHLLAHGARRREAIDRIVHLCSMVAFEKLTERLQRLQGRRDTGLSKYCLPTATPPTYHYAELRPV